MTLFDFLTPEKPDDRYQSDSFSDALTRWSLGKGPAPTQCGTVEARRQCVKVSDHVGDCDIRQAIPDTKPIWRILWTDTHGRDRILQVRRDLYPDPEAALGILDSTYGSYIGQVGRVVATFA